MRNDLYTIKLTEDEIRAILALLPNPRPNMYHDYIYNKLHNALDKNANS